MSRLVVIPARYASTRFPGKPLAPLRGKALLLHVAERAREAGFEPVVATDDSRIVALAEGAGLRTLMTRDDHPCGTDRVAEVLRRLDPPGGPDSVVLNLQGDEPFLEPSALRAVLACFDDPGVQMATAAAPLDPSEAASPHIVKLVVDAAGRALYFSRATIPWSDAQSPASPLRRHLGIYAYRRHTLVRLAALPPCASERSERLEQLRALHHGIPIHVATVPRAWRGVDTPEDLAALEAVTSDFAEQP